MDMFSGAFSFWRTTFIVWAAFNTFYSVRCGSLLIKYNRFCVYATKLFCSRNAMATDWFGWALELSLSFYSVDFSFYKSEFDGFFVIYPVYSYRICYSWSSDCRDGAYTEQNDSTVIMFVYTARIFSSFK